MTQFSTIQRGKIHEFLGMTRDFTKQGRVMILMTDYIENMPDSLDSDMDGVKTTPAASYLFDVNPNAECLNEGKALVFHYFVAKTLFLCKQSRPDL